MGDEWSKHLLVGSVARCIAAGFALHALAGCSISTAGVACGAECDDAGIAPDDATSGHTMHDAHGADETRPPHDAFAVTDGAANDSSSVDAGHTHHDASPADTGHDAGCHDSSDCPTGQACDPETGVCGTSCSGGLTCNGGCCGGDQCQPGNALAACGGDGACVDCTVTCPTDAVCMPACSSNRCTGSAVFSPSESEQDLTVPPSVTQVTITALGAAGGSSENGGTGGLGGSTTATISIGPSDVLAVFVGTQGIAATGTCNGFMGGFNGGGGGTGCGGGGGGASDVRIGGNTLPDRVVVAGGGGGADLGAGGSGGPATAGNGHDGSSGATGGGGGTQTQGGGGGGNGGCSGGSGGSGVAGAGGGGQSGGGGGGGGSGYFGGGGGSGGGSPCTAGGGGGGSSFATSTATMTQGTQSGDGQVTITW